MNLKSPKKRLVIGLSILVGLGSCSLNKELPFDPVYYSYHKSQIEQTKISKKQNLETKTFNFNFGHLNYLSMPQRVLNWSWYSNLYGNYGWGSSWSNIFGPFIDINNDGIIDWEDFLIEESSTFFWDFRMPYYFGENPFWDNYFFPLYRNNQNPSYYGPRKGFNHNLPGQINSHNEIFNRKREINKRNNIRIPTQKEKYKLPKTRRFNYPIRRKRNNFPRKMNFQLKRDLRNKKIPPKNIYRIKKIIK